MHATGYNRELHRIDVDERSGRGDGMDDDHAEAVLLALLARLTDADDPAMADHAIDLYLASFDQDARRAALTRLTHTLLARPEEPAATTAPDILGALRRLPN